MKIQLVPTSKFTKLSHVEPGEVFRLEEGDTVFMRVVADTSVPFDYRDELLPVLRIGSGQLTMLASDTSCYLLDAKLLVEEMVVWNDPNS